VAYDPYNRRFPDRWHLNGVSDEVVRSVLAARTQMKREMPESAGPSDLVIASLFVAHELLANNWKAVNAAGVKERSFKLAEAIADITQVLVDLTGRSEEELSGKRELERRRAKREAAAQLQAEHHERRHQRTRRRPF
jgi:hypothetical protein